MSEQSVEHASAHVAKLRAEGLTKQSFFLPSEWAYVPDLFALADEVQRLREVSDLERAVVEAAITWRAENHAEHVSGEAARASYIGLLEAIEALLKAREKK